MDNRNDYELVYLYQVNPSDELLQIIFTKYKPLIWKKINQFYIPSKDHDDYFQESLMVLLQCMNQFSAQKNKTFTKYFEMILHRKFIMLKKKSTDYVLVEKAELIKESYTPIMDYINIEDIYLSPLETKVYELYFVERMLMDSIANKLNISLKSVKNAVYRIKKKIT